VLDVACGTGVVARLAAERVGAGGQITGLDLNEGMLDVARSLPSPAGAAAHNPYIAALGDALERHVSAEVAAGSRTVCALGEAEALRSLLLQAGFREVRIAIAILVMRFASVEAFVPGQFAATPYAGAVAALDANARTALLEDVRVALKSYTDDTGVAVPTEAHVAIART
jgi:SAM-dependent methyltransferase